MRRLAKYVGAKARDPNVISKARFPVFQIRKLSNVHPETIAACCHDRSAFSCLRKKMLSTAVPPMATLIAWRAVATSRECAFAKVRKRKQ